MIWRRWRNPADEETQNEDEETQNEEQFDDEDEKGETRVPRRFLSTSSITPYKSRLKNSIFILELEF